MVARFVSGTPILLERHVPQRAGIGRIGSIIGPLVGAWFVGLPVEKLYMWSSLPFALGAVVCFAIRKLSEARLQAHPELRAAQAPAT